MSHSHLHSPVRRTDLLRILNQVWDIRKPKMNWLEMEDTLVDILKCSELSAEEKVAFAKECVDAYTRRGHFADEAKEFPTMKLIKKPMRFDF